MLKLAAIGFAIALLAAAGGLAFTHAAIRAIEPPLPAVGALLESAANARTDRLDLPTRLSWINTAAQWMPASQVLALRSDEPDPSFSMSHPAFVLEWDDGRMFLFDLGMDAASAKDFGAVLEWVGAQPIEVLGSTASWLGPEAVARVAGVAFSHLHVDHTSGAAELCAAHPGRIRWVRSAGQAERSNYTTRGARQQLEAAPCLDPEDLRAEPLAAVPGFPGLAFVEAGGHTPGSQMAVIQLRGAASVETWVLAGDVANHFEGILQNRPKPLLYQLFVTPEAPDRLERVRAWLGDIESAPRGHVAIAHDGARLRSSGLPEWSAAAGERL
jgi:glyoxylase-like metal-dependent hydrolase (beta-lactamase superfamily II)